MQFLIGFLLALAITAAAHRLRALSRSGALAALALGTAIYGFGGWRSALILLIFFFSSSALGRWLQGFGRHAEGIYSKGGERDAGQVLGNGLTAGVFAAAAHFSPGALWPWAAFAGAVAAVTADTWATEVGALSAGQPRLITRIRQRVPAGTSGGVSGKGTLAAGMGSLIIAAATVLLRPEAGVQLACAIWIGGMVGSTADSMLGATVQAMYQCPTDKVMTEQHPLHRCGSQTHHVRGWPWLNNDRVNLACSVVGALSACLIASLAGTG
jgi:uncharacterized protein (TIGR00297 family)